ncbi:hypothetical protein J4481_01320 [Candidatus Pacearchaeota archaeon]|nr:hypothetical protein [Candidatus Pacearchaeota archaeon]
MCFTPAVSLSIAIIEWILTTIILIFFKRTNFRMYFAWIIYVLGFYQFTEFMLCTSNNAFLWAKLGFITYTLLPALVLHSVLRISGKNMKVFGIYLIPFAFSLLAIINSNFITGAKCTAVFVQVRLALIENPGLLQSSVSWIYMAYYFGFIVLALAFILKDYLHQKNKIKRKIRIIAFIGTIMMLVPTLLLMVVLPHFNAGFPSVLCGFALFFAIATFIIAYLETKLKKIN